MQSGKGDCRCALFAERLRITQRGCPTRRPLRMGGFEPSQSVALPRLALLCSKLENNAPVGIELGGFLQINAV
jgi:hypothetical protein